MESIISIEELCKALGVEYDRSKSSAYYLHMVKDYRFHYEASPKNDVTICQDCNEPLNSHHQAGGKFFCKSPSPK